MKWQPEHDDMLRKLHPVKGIVMRDIAAMINEAHGTGFKPFHISLRSAQLGLPKRNRPWAPKQRVSRWWDA